MFGKKAAIALMIGIAGLLYIIEQIGRVPGARCEAKVFEELVRCGYPEKTEYIPEWLPKTALDIHAELDLDIMLVWVQFLLPPTGSSPDASCTVVPVSSLLEKLPERAPPWWTLVSSAVESTPEGFEGYRCEKGRGYLLVDKASSRWHFWSPREW